MLFGWLAAFYNVPEGVSAPLAASLGGGAVAVGLILAVAGPRGLDGRHRLQPTRRSRPGGCAGWARWR